MPINPNIALGIQLPQVQAVDPAAGMNSLMRAMQISGALDEQKVNALKLQELQRGVDETAKLNSLYAGAVGPDGTIDRTKLFAGLASGNLGSKIPAIQKTLLETDEARYKLQNEAAKGYKLFQTTIGAHAAQPVPSRDAVVSSVRGLVSSGSMDPTVAQRMLDEMPVDPVQLKQYLTRAATSQMDPQHMFTVFAPKPTEVDDGQHKFFKDTNPNSPTFGQMVGGAAVQKVATPGEVLADTRAKDTLAQGKWHYDADRGGLVNMQTGEFKPATQGGKPIDPKDKGLNDSQAKANLFGTRMQEADKVLTKMADAGVMRPGTIKGVAESLGNIAGLGTESMGGALSDAAGSLTNWTQSPEQQQVEQAQRDFLNATLRRESGASISPAEFRNGNKQYFPQPGDDAATLEQKARNRKVAIQGILAEVPENKRTQVAPASTTAGGVPLVNAKGWTLHTDAKGNRAYVSPDGKQFEVAK